jgi:hypothetical protein
MLLLCNAYDSGRTLQWFACSCGPLTAVPRLRLCCALVAMASPIPPAQVRRSYPLKCLHDIRVLNRKAGTTPTTAGTTTAAAAAGDANGGPDQAGGGQQSWVELRFASHHEVAEHRGCYLLPDAARLLFFISLVTQVLRCVGGVGGWGG